MELRTDLALEARQWQGKDLPGAQEEQETIGRLTCTRIHVQTEEAARKIGKPPGCYITLEGLPLTEHFQEAEEEIRLAARELSSLLPPEGTVLVAGVGNSDITPDALGPAAAHGVLATRHLAGEQAKSLGLPPMRSVAVLSPGVLGQTGMETFEWIEAAVRTVSPAAVIVIDALAAGDLRHLGRTVQFSDTGLTPGEGIGNRRKPLCRDTLGVPVISMGIPTVVEGTTLARGLFPDLPRRLPPETARMIVTPKEIDLLIRRASVLLSMTINCALQPLYSLQDLALLS